MLSAMEELLKYRQALREVLGKVGVIMKPDETDDVIIAAAARTITGDSPHRGTDCETLSDGASQIFRKLEPHFPPDPWNKPQWEAEGIVSNNGKFDLRKSFDRDRLERQVRSTIASFVEVKAGVYTKEHGGSLGGFEIDHFGPMIRQKMELLLILRDLDFQIETGDLLEG